MPRKFFKRYMPDPHQIKQNKSISVFGNWLHDPNLWHLNRRSVAGAFAVGLFFAWWPVPLQMLFAAAAAIVFRTNLPISVGLVWISNPITMPPMFYFAYKVGAWLIGTPERAFEFEPTVEWIASELAIIWKPFLTGCMSLAIISSMIGFFAIHIIWRYSVIRRRNRRYRYLS